MPNSYTVSPGDDILAADHNLLREDVLVDHIHDGTDGNSNLYPASVNITSDSDDTIVIDQNDNYRSINIDSEATTADAILVDGLGSGHLINLVHAGSGNLINLTNNGSGNYIAAANGDFKIDSDGIDKLGSYTAEEIIFFTW